MTRLPPQPGERIDRSTTVRFRFDGRSVTGHEGDTIASALYAAGRRTFSRSFKYHRRRGLLCCTGQCANCLVDVDGAPGVRACTEPLREGIEVSHQNAFPSLDFDVMRATDLVGGPFTPPGFYYKTFIHPRRLWPLYERVLRSAAGLGRLRKHQADREWRTEYRRRHADVLVIGGGAAGLSAAIRAAELGADVVLAEEGPEPGGRLLGEGGAARAAELAARAAELGVEVLCSAPALGFFDGLVPVWQHDTLHQVRARQFVAATGTIEQPLVFAGNDLPGVMLSGGARRLAALYGVRPGRCAVVATTGERGLEAALALRDAGVEIAAVADLRPAPAGPAGDALRAAGVELLSGATVLAAEGRRQVTAAVLGDAAGERTVACDLLLVSGGFVPADSLLAQAGARPRYDEVAGCFRATELPEHVLAAGELVGAQDAQAAELSGSIAGAAAAHALGLGDRDSSRRLEADRAALERPPDLVAPAVAAPCATGEGRGKCFVCPCEDVTSKDLDYGVSEGYDSLELTKRYTTVTMGPCQGRMCQLASAKVLGRATGRPVADVGVTTARPPWSTVPLGALAGRPFHPAKRSALHGLHRDAGANVMWAGDWRRAYDYGDPQGEALAVHRAAGLIDVSSLGKLLVRGPEAGAFLDRLYPNRFSDLKPGRVRYGVLNTDAGRIFDDGTICRLDDDTFYVTTTSSGAGAVEEWFAWWQADWGMAVHITDVTQALAAMNLAGPRAREILSGLTSEDCSNDALSYLDGRPAHIAGVPCLILRIGFVGELGYELHVAASHAEHVWSTILDAGADVGIRRFGLEPQRILRLQKLHVIVGQDTDSESTAPAAAMPWIVKLDKADDFVGRWALEHAGERALETTLVGFSVADGDLPSEGAAVVAGGIVAGRVTSSRYSPQLDRVIGMAWVPAALARDGSEITISEDGRRLTGEVTTRPFYDPEGKVLRS